MKTIAAVLLFAWQVVVMLQLWSLNYRLNRIEEASVRRDAGQ